MYETNREYGYGMMIRFALLVAESGVSRDFFAVLVAGLAGIAVLFYAAASDLFDLKLFKFDPYAFRLPREARVEYWYTRAAKRFESFLADGGWSYAKAKKQARVRVKRDWRRMRKETRRMLPEAVKRLNRDVALGALAIAIVLVALLIISLV
ncbi:MAG: hypothetical protein C4536_10315 [Actinobacteria bacterium]|jgi:hypothetical protein|nr:MAG: hypothetical protein C4536_10315 [Actinomycetota bacterium]